MLRTAVIVATVVMASGATRADESTGVRWIVSEGTLYGKPTQDGDPRGERAADVSGLACAPEKSGRRICLLVDDESQGGQVVIAGAGTLLAGDMIRLTDASFEGKPLELDAEAVAWEEDAFYIIGSHGRPRHEQDSKEEKNVARAQVTRSLYRIRLKQGGVDLATGRLKARPVITNSRDLGPLIVAQPELAPSFDEALADGGVTIEGLAIRRDVAFIGFRGPVLGGRAAILAVPLARLFSPSGGAPTTLLRADLGQDTLGNPRGVRDLATVDGGFVGIAGPVLDPADKSYAIRAGDYALFWWSGGRPPVMRELGGFPAQTKPEGLMPLSFSGGSLKALLLFDGPTDGDVREIEAKFPGLAISRLKPLERAPVP